MSEAYEQFFDSVKDQRGIKPETLPPEEDIKKLERRVSTDAKKLGNQAGHLPKPGGTV